MLLGDALAYVAARLSSLSIGNPRMSVPFRRQAIHLSVPYSSRRSLEPVTCGLMRVAFKVDRDVYQ